jgi:hypothetical protein
MEEPRENRTPGLLRTVRPVVWEGHGRWLAVSAPASTPRIGVIGETRAEAETRFSEALDRWVSYQAD